MLSYKHGYHAGNHADVMKHIIMLYLYNLEKKVNKSKLKEKLIKFKNSKNHKEFMEKIKE